MNISVYITSFNQKDYLKEAIESVLKQTLLPDEILILDDASQDGSKELIVHYANKYPNLIRYHFNEINLGITKTRNIALSMVTGDYITWLDGDDVYLPEKIETQYKIALKDKVQIVYTNFYLSTEQIDNIEKIWFCDINKIPKIEEHLYAVLTRSFPRGILFRYELVSKRLIDEIGLYDENLEIYEDFEFRIRLVKNGTVSYSILPLSIYRLHGAGLSRARRETHFQCLKYIYEKHDNILNDLSEELRNKAKEAINDLMSKFSNKKNKNLNLSIIEVIKGRLNKFLKYYR